MPAMLCAGCCKTVDLEYDDVYWSNKIGQYICEGCVPELGVKKVINPWTTSEVEYIRKYYKSDGAKRLAAALDRTIESVKGKVRTIGLRKRETGIPWSSSDDSYLIENYQTKSNRSIGKHLNRTIRAVNSRVSVLRQNGVDIQPKGKQNGKEV